jgi:hypothetical protein
MDLSFGKHLVRIKVPKYLGNDLACFLIRGSDHGQFLLVGDNKSPVRGG